MSASNRGTQGRNPPVHGILRKGKRWCAVDMALKTSLRMVDIQYRVAKKALDKASRRRNETVAELRANGVPYSQIAKELGISVPGVQAILRRAGK